MLKAVAVVLLVHCALAAPALAQSRCRVMDPTGTPLNVRTAPQGPIVEVLHNGVLVTVLDSAVDQNGNSWAYVARMTDAAPVGWVFREFISCF